MKTISIAELSTTELINVIQKLKHDLKKAELQNSKLRTRLSYHRLRNSKMKSIILFQRNRIIELHSMEKL